ncbi:probable (S)-N-methylcoclaurine 3'-hydroxylase isozyme 2 [Cornus florida]|uniref:probable (S)-N-methylcoclaurine 3'-hydroxylase isozyme 2 n=1 Tax=Cornus florida TaxID=4283 RepID=UPI0028A18655|nr:probable (S)-N-methylcoclaurine 3'-hydroxylase isozyme 2 [Cornus florida]
MFCVLEGRTSSQVEFRTRASNSSHMVVRHYGCFLACVTEVGSIGSGKHLFSSGVDAAKLLKDEEVVQKFRIEHAKVIGGDALKESHLPYLPYLQACLKETLKLHLPVPFLMPHRALHKCKVMNYTIPKDSIVLVNIWAIG